MNRRRVRLLRLVGLVIAGMLLFPPFYTLTGTVKRPESMGYFFIFGAGPRGAFLNVSQLLAQWLGVCLVAGIAWVLRGDQGEPTPPRTDAHGKTASVVAIWVGVVGLVASALTVFWVASTRVPCPPIAQSHPDSIVGTIETLPPGVGAALSHRPPITQGTTRSAGQQVPTGDAPHGFEVVGRLAPVDPSPGPLPKPDSHQR